MNFTRLPWKINLVLSSRVESRTGICGPELYIEMH